MNKTFGNHCLPFINISSFDTILGFPKLSVQQTMNHLNGIKLNFRKSYFRTNSFGNFLSNETRVKCQNMSRMVTTDYRLIRQSVISCQWVGYCSQLLFKLSKLHSMGRTVCQSSEMTNSLVKIAKCFASVWRLFRWPPTVSAHNCSSRSRRALSVRMPSMASVSTCHVWSPSSLCHSSDGPYVQRVGQSSTNPVYNRLSA